MKNTAILILAAGGSVRMGKPKLAEKFLGTNLIERVLEAVSVFDEYPKLIVLGGYKEAYLPQVENSNINFIFNSEWQNGLSTSINVGIEWFNTKYEEEIENVMILLADMALVNSEYLEKIIKSAKGSTKGIIASNYGPSLGPPAIFNKKYFNELQSLEGDRGAKSVILKHMEDLQTLEFLDGLIDIDTPEDLKRFNSGQ
jgi:molybdenum cofactor cytidylyltransferase